MESKYNENQPEYYYGIGCETVPGGIFERFPELIPAVGCNYWREDGVHKKMLMVGESNYFPDYSEEVSVFKDAEKWYHANTDKLIPQEMKSAVKNWKDYVTFNKVYKIIGEVLRERQIPYQEGLNESAFYNYFLRPALNGKDKGFKPQAIDKMISGIALTEIIKRLTPDIVIFLSKKAFIEYEYYRTHYLSNSYSTQFYYVVHPASAWWYAYNGSLGQKRFKDILCRHWLSENLSVTSDLNNNNIIMENSKYDLFVEKRAEIEQALDSISQLKGEIIASRNEQISCIASIMKECTDDASWWIYQYVDLGITFNEQGHRIGIESWFVEDNGNPCAHYYICITTWKAADYLPYKDVILNRFADYLPREEYREKRVYLHLIDTIPGNDLDMIVEKLTDVYNRMKAITTEIK